MKNKTSQSLCIYLNQIRLGTLQIAKSQNLKFSYHKEWLSRPQAFPISRSLPLRETPFEDPVVFNYFENLLPDASSVRQQLAAKLQAKSDGVFDLLSVLGRDCVGALQFFHPDQEPPKSLPAKGTKISRKEIEKYLLELKTFPLLGPNEQDFRISIAGMQEKTAFLKIQKQWFIPTGSTATTHIFKPQLTDHSMGFHFPYLVENEWLCSEILRSFEIDTARGQIATFGNIPTLIIERFDRIWVQKKLIRIPQEDLCQALGFPSYKKYENDGGPGVLQIMNLLSESRFPHEDRSQFMKAQVLFFLLTATDGHAKNFSLRWSFEGFSLAPLYDVISVQPLVDQGHLPIEKVKMSMTIGKKRSYKVHQIFRRHFLQTAELCRFEVDKLNEMIDEVLLQLPLVIQKVTSNLPKNFPQPLADSIFQGMKKRAQQLEL